ncbi:unnamed protein product [Arabis nemorensis]|uniref:Uncharacterized protein n=1 Tax=Arabis nemorensis TaxID=586526 RepID=A0A565BY60_9BRAS|nr:unnamed protein product [Arabis nemorensis]
MAARAMPYTGGDIKKSSELGRMFDISVPDPTSFQGPASISGSVRSGSQSGPIRKSSRPLSQLQLTGLITSDPLNSSGSRSSCQIDHHLLRSSNSRSTKPKYGSAVTILNPDLVRIRFRVPKPVIWAVLIVAAMGLLVGVFLSVAEKKPLGMVVIAAAIFSAVVVLCGIVFGEEEDCWVSSIIIQMLCSEAPLT